MIVLTQSQQSLVSQLQHLALSSLAHLPATLIQGPPGVGKRAVVGRLAEEFGIEIVEVNVSDSAAFITARLFGATRAVEVPTEPSQLGECGRPGEFILYLSGFENLKNDEPLHHALHRVLTRRTYIDAAGDERRIGDGVWIIAALRDRTDSSNQVCVDLNHWLCAHFAHQLRLDAPSDAEELAAVVGKTLGEYGVSIETAPGDELLEYLRDAPDCFRALRRWLAGAARHRNKAGLVRMENIHRAIFEDLETSFMRIRYLGRPIESARFERWARQFGDLQWAAVHMVRWIARSYFISDTEYFQAIDHLIQRSGIRSNSDVIFCKSQSEGHSGPRVAHQIKNRAKWRTAARDIDLTGDEDFWPQLDPLAPHQLVIVDDFVGSGRTIAKLFSGCRAPVPRLLKRLPNARLWIGIIAGFESAIQEALAGLNELGARVNCTPYRLLSEEDKCFSDNSRVFPNAATREQIRQFCLSAADTYYPSLPSRFRLGFDDTGALMVFFDTVPNNSLPLLWHTDGHWFPLFPASGV